MVKSILSNIKVEAKTAKVYLSATGFRNLYKDICKYIADTLELGLTSIPAKQLSNTFKTINFPEALIGA